MLSIIAVVGSHEFGLHIRGGSQRGSLIRTGREDLASGCDNLPTLSQGLEIEHSDFEAEDAMLNGHHPSQVFEIVIGGDPTILAVHFMGMFMSLSRILWQGSVLTNLFNPIRHQVDLWNVEVVIYDDGNIYHVPDSIPRGFHFVPLVGQFSSVIICLLVYLSLLHNFRTQGIGFDLHCFAGSPE